MSRGESNRRVCAPPAARARLWVALCLTAGQGASLALAQPVAHWQVRGEARAQADGQAQAQPQRHPQAAPPRPAAAHARTPTTGPAASPAVQHLDFSYDPQVHDALIAQVRAGQASWRQALSTLQGWAVLPLARDERQRVLADLVLAARSAGHPEAAAAAARAAGAAQLPLYALPYAVAAARAIPDHPLQGELVRAWLARAPDAVDAHVQQVLWHIDSGQYAQADAAIAALAQRTRPQAASPVTVLELRGALAEARVQPLRALAIYQSLRALAPDHAYARRAPAFLLAGIDAPAAAQTHARAEEAAHPATFSALEQAELAQQALGQSLQWAVRDRDQRTGEGPARHDALRAVLDRFAPLQAELAQGLASAQAEDPARVPAWRDIAHRLAFDEVVALAAAGRYADVISRHEDLQAQGIEPPYYVLAAVAGAHQFHRRSDLAVPLYEAALRDGGDALPSPSDVHVGLVFAYLDTARFEQAEGLLRQLEATTPPHLRLTPEAGRINPDYTQVRHLRALALLYADRVPEARAQFDLLVDHAPLHAGARAGQAQVAQRQERPERALALYESLATDYPDDIAARAGHIGALQVAGHHRESRERLAVLNAEAPEAIAVRNARRAMAHERATRLDVEAGVARDGGTLSNRDERLDVQLASPLLADGWRVYARQVAAQARVDGERVRLARTGLGVSWAQGRWEAAGEVHRATSGTPRHGVAVAVDYRAGDAWRLSAEADTHSLQTPWRARLAGIGGRDVGATARWVGSDTRNVALRYTHLALTDGNRRQGAGVDWNERWVSGPRFKFDTTLSVDAGRYAQQDVPYFSPARESAAALAVRAEYLSWKRDDRRFVQAIEASGGGYRQAGFGTGALWQLRYVHEWRVGETFALRYGVGTGSHPYDGVAERRHEFFLTLSMPLMP